MGLLALTSLRRLSRSDIPWRGVVVCGAGVLYPQWQRLAPPSGNDPVWVWWCIGAAIAAAGLLSVLRTRQAWLGELAVSGIACLVTLQLFALASLNDMHPFYALGSTMTVMATAFYIRHRARLVAYTGWVAALAIVFFLLNPDERMLAYWGGPFPLLAFAFYRLRAQARDESLEQRYRAELEAQVAARTEDLMEANRRLEREMLERERLEGEMRVAQKMEAVGSLTGGIAHDFNNIITTIGIYAELVKASMPEDSPQRSDVAQIEESASEAAALVRSLIAVSKPGTGETEILDLREVAQDMAGLIRNILGEDSQLVLELPDEPCCTRANLDETRQILLNLALNARDATPQGGVLTIEVYTAEATPGMETYDQDAEHASEYVVLAVSDTGVGMDAETQTRIFEPFFTTKGARRGTGLGLSTVYGTVKQRGGHIRVESAPGEGARFELFLPRSDEPVFVVPEDASVRSHMGSGRILLVEDEADLRRALHRVLADSGYDVVEAADGQAALERARMPGEHFDLVVSDVVLPRMSGIELAEELESMRLPTRVLLLSGYTSHPTLENRAIPKHAAFLAKPFSHLDLTAKVRETLDAPLV